MAHMAAHKAALDSDQSGTGGEGLRLRAGRRPASLVQRG